LQALTRQAARRMQAYLLEGGDAPVPSRRPSCSSVATTDVADGAASSFSRTLSGMNAASSPRGSPRGSMFFLGELGSDEQGSMSFVVDWEEDHSQCSLCGCKVGKLTRHHCRLCGRCVCSSCSPSSVRLDKSSPARRACNPCVAAAQLVPWVKTRVQQLGWRLWDLAGDDAQLEPGTEVSLEVVLLRCEEALRPLEDRLVAAMSRAGHAEATAALESHAKQELQAEVVQAREFLMKLARQLRAAAGRCSGQESTSVSFAEMSGVDDVSRTSTLFSSRASSLDDATSSCETSASLVLAALRAACTKSELSADSSAEVQQPLPTFGFSGPSFDVEGVYMKPLPPCDWEMARQCNGCKSKLGKRHLRRRHHCRLCGRSVCATCSPSKVQFESVRTPHRVCTPCIRRAYHSSLASVRTCGARRVYQT